MKEYYIVLTVFLGAAIWISCAAISSANTGISTSVSTAQTYSPEFYPSKTLFFIDESQDIIINSQQPSAPRMVARAGVHVNDLIECRKILDTVTHLNNNTMKLMTPPEESFKH